MSSEIIKGIKVPTEDPEGVGRMGEHAQSLSKLADQLRDLTTKARIIGDRFFGQRPAAVEEDDDAAKTAPGLVYQLQGRVTTLEAEVKRLDGYLDRLTEL